jgi:NADH dehydrogenase
LTIEGHPQAFVIGDVAACTDAAGCAMPGLAPVAIQQGRCAARNIVKALAGKPYEQFKYVDKGALATVGRAFAILQLGKVKLSGLFAWLIWSLVHVAYLIGFRNRMIVMFEWAWAYITYQRGARLITGDIEALMAPPRERHESVEITHTESRL